MSNAVFKFVMAMCCAFWSLLAVYNYHSSSPEKSIAASALAIVFALCAIAFQDREDK
jgi:hypothetical protein